MSRIRPLVILPAALLAVALLLPGQASSAQEPPAAAGPRLTRTAFTLLMERAYQPPDARLLLTAAWDAGLTLALSEGYRGALPGVPALTGNTEQAWAAFVAAWPALVALLPPEAPVQRLEHAVIAAMAGAVPDGGARFVPSAAEPVTPGRWSGTGAGVRLTERVPWIVLERAPDSAAQRAGLRPGDVILEVDGNDVTALARPALNRLLERPAGAALSLTVDRPNAGRVVLALTASPFAFPLLDEALLPGGGGQVSIRAFPAVPGSMALGDEVAAAWTRLRDAGATRLLLDLRNNAGGDGFAMAEVAGLFLGEGAAYSLRDAHGTAGVRQVAALPLLHQPPLVVLVNGGTGGVAEVLAATLRDSGRAALAGTPTTGNATHIIPFPLGDGSLLQIAVAELRSGRGGDAIAGAGVTPDLIVPDTRTAAGYAAGDDPQRDAAARLLVERPAPEPPPAPGGPVRATREMIHRTLNPYLPAALDLPVPAGGPPFALAGERAFVLPEQWSAWLGPVEHGAAPAGLARGRGWQGGVVRSFTAGAQVFTIRIDLYTSPSGAFTALQAEDAGLTFRTLPAAIPAVDGARVLTGRWTAEGTTMLAFRAGHAVVTVSLTGLAAAPLDPLTAVAVMVAARFQAMPLATGE